MDPDVELIIAATRIVLVLVVTFFTARTIVFRRRALENRLDSKFNEHNTIESKIYDAEGLKIQSHCTISKNIEIYTLKLVSDRSEKIGRHFSNLEELEAYLEAETCFRIADFVVPKGVSGVS